MENTPHSTNRQDGKFIIALSRTLQHLHQKSEKLFYQHGVTMAQFMVLEALYHKGKMPIKEIIRAVLSSSGNITVVIRNLERRGLVSRASNTADKRSFMVQITDAGKDLLLPLYTQHMAFVAQALAPIAEQEKAYIIATLKKLQGNEEGEKSD